MRYSIKIIFGLLLVTINLLPLGCGQGGRHQVTLRFWNGFTGPDGRTMLKLVKRFNEQNPGVNVIMQRSDWATYYNKLFVAGLNSRGPEVFVIHTRAIPRIVEGRFVRAIDDLVNGPNGVPTSDLDPNIWKATEVGGRHYGLPLDVHPIGMYVNKRLFREAGLTDATGAPRIPTNREEFVAALRKLTKPAQGDRPAHWGFVFVNLTSNTYTIMRQFGGQFFTPDNSRCIMNNPQNVAALQFCVDLIRKEKLVAPPENGEAWIGFRQGHVAMAWEGIFMLADLQKQKDLEHMGAPTPQLGPFKADWADSHNLCLRADMKGETLQWARKFVTFLSDNSVDWAAGGQIPVRISLRNTARFRSMSVQYTFSKQIPYVSYFPCLPFIFEFNTALDQAIEKALRGSASPQEALDEATTKVNAIIARRQRDLAEAHLADTRPGGKP